MIDLKELEEKIVAQCEKRKAEGWTIAQGLGYVYSKPTGGCRACAIGAFGTEADAVDPVDRIRYEGMRGYSEIAIQELGLSFIQYSSFANGFDGHRISPDPDFHALGQRVAARVL